MFTKPEFHYSEDECCFVPKKNTYKVYSIKFLGVLLLSVSLSVTMITIYGQEIFLDEKEKQMVSEISELKERLQAMNVQFKKLTESDDLLRTEVNLPLLDKEEKELGIGGSRQSVSSLDVSDPEAILKASEKMVGQLAKKIEMQRTSYMEIMRQYETNEKLFNCMPAIRPCNGHVTSDFGMRLHPIFKVRRFHAGMDFSARIGTPVHVTGDGVVELVARNGGFGKMVRVNHGFGYKTIYAHLSEFKVKKGDRVKRGDVIALSGNTGISEGPHLHYEVIKNGIKMQPRNFIFDDFGPREYIAAAKVSGL